MSSASEIKLKIESGIYSTAKKNSKSEIFNIFREIKNNGEDIKNFIFCSRCKNVYKFNVKCTSNLLRHNCFIKYKSSKENSLPKVEPNTELKKKCTDLVVQWVVGNCRPFNVVNDEGLLNLAQFCVNTGHVFGKNLDVGGLLPHSTTVSRNIGSLYNNQHKILKEELCSIKEIGFSITCDLWSDNYLKTSYIGATVHYIKSGNIESKVLGMIGMGSDRNTGRFLSAIINIIKLFVFLFISENKSLQTFNI